MSPAVNLADRARAVLGGLSSLAAGALDDVGTVTGLKPFQGRYVIVDAWLPTPRLSAARRLVAADPAAWCPLRESDAVLGIAGPVRGEAGAPWRYRLVIVRCADLLSPDGRALRDRCVTDEATGLTITLPAPPRRLTPVESRGLLAAAALVLSVSWALTGLAVFLENSARSTTQAARALAASPSMAESGYDTGARHAASLLSAIAGQEGELAVTRIMISGDASTLTRSDGTSLVPAVSGDETITERASGRADAAEPGDEP
jgi:hypothetical protein